MIHRMFREKATGRWAAAVLSQDVFTTTATRTVIVRSLYGNEREITEPYDVADDGSAYAARLAVDLGLAPDALEVVDVEDGEPDPREGLLLEPVPVEPEAEAAPEPIAPVEFSTTLRGATGEEPK